MFKKKKQDKSLPSREFNVVISFVANIIKDVSIISDKVDLIDFAMKSIKRDLQYDLLSDLLYKYPNEAVDIKRFIPTLVYDESNNLIECCDDEPNKAIDLSTDCVIVVPWKPESLITSIKTILKEGFQYDCNNHVGYYFECLDMCYMESGNHHISVAIQNRTGELKVKRFYTQKYFEHLRTDGTYWYNTHTNMKIDEVYDFRIAILYELAKLKNKLKSLGGDNMTAETKELSIRELTDEDVVRIEEMMSFYGIPEDEAYNRYVLSNFGEVDVIVEDIEQE